MNIENLFDKYLEAVRTGKAPTLRFGWRAGIRAFSDWAERRGYEIVQTKGENGAAIFCAKCGGLISPAEMANEPE